jgi:potassium uptake TrkH family protein
VDHLSTRRNRYRHGVPLRRLTSAVNNPAQLVVMAFAAAIGLGTLLLWLPWSFEDDARVGLIDAVFLATSSVTVTGLSTVDLAALSLVGELIVLSLIQIGGFGIMTVGSLLALLAVRRFGLRQRILAQAEIGAVHPGEMRALVGSIARITLAVEGVLAVVLAVRLWLTYDVEPVAALYEGAFHAVSAFNNAGISLYGDSLSRFLDDPVIILAVSCAFILGGLGFPVIVQLRRTLRPSHWTLHTRITVIGTAALVVLGPVMVAAFEWGNARTLGGAPWSERLLGAWFQGVTPRTAGFNVVDVGAMEEPTLLGTSMLMFIGGGPASTAGGIKVTTFALLAFVLWSEVRGDADVNVLHRRLPAAAIRQAVTVVILAIGSVVAATLVLLASTDLMLTPALFEAVSAFATVGLSTGITGELPMVAKFALVLLMIAGRVGPTTLVTALAYRQRLQRFHYPEERPLIG